MDEKKLLEKLKKSTQYTEIPKKLEPDHIHSVLKDKTVKKQKSRSPVYKITALAAALLVIFVIAWQFQPIGDNPDKNVGSQSAEVAKDTADNTKETAAVYAQGDMAPIDNYDTLFEKLKENIIKNEQQP